MTKTGEHEKVIKISMTLPPATLEKLDEMASTMSMNRSAFVTWMVQSMASLGADKTLNRVVGGVIKHLVETRKK